MPFFVRFYTLYSGGLSIIVQQYFLNEIDTEELREKKKRELVICLIFINKIL